MTKSKATHQAVAAKIQPDNPDKFSIVGIGASAGGLEAFEQFFKYCLKERPAEVSLLFKESLLISLLMELQHDS